MGGNIQFLIPVKDWFRFLTNRLQWLNESIAKFQITIHVEEVKSALKDDDSWYNEKETYVLGYSPSKFENPSLVSISLWFCIPGHYLILN